MKLIFVKTSGIFGALVRFFDGGEYNHVAIKLSDTMCCDSSIGLGVRYRFVSSVKKSAKIYKEIDIPISDEKLITANIWLENQLGKEYDTWAVASLALRSIFGTAPNTASVDKFFCDELAATYLVKLSINIPGPLRNIGVEKFHQIVRSLPGATEKIIV